MTWEWSFALEIMPELLVGVWYTIVVTVGCAVIALGGGLAVTVFASLSGRAGQRLATTLVDFLRGVPILVLLFFGFYALPAIGITLPGIAVGTIVLGTIYAAYCSEVYRGGLIAINPGIRDACSALGLPTWVVWGRVLLPLAIRSSLPALMNYMLILYRETAYLFAIGVPVLLSQARIVGSETYRYLEPYTLAGVLYLAMNLPFVYLLHRYEVKNATRTA